MWKTSKFRNPEHLLSPDQRDGNNKSVLNNAFLSNSTIMKLSNGSFLDIHFIWRKCKFVVIHQQWCHCWASKCDKALVSNRISGVRPSFSFWDKKAIIWYPMRFPLLAPSFSLFIEENVKQNVQKCKMFKNVKQNVQGEASAVWMWNNVFAGTRRLQMCKFSKLILLQL